jgi:hypothetical protein
MLDGWDQITGGYSAMQWLLRNGFMRIEIPKKFQGRIYTRGWRMELYDS